MKIFFIVLALLCTVLGVGVPYYLGPDDIRGCDMSAPSGKAPCTPADAIVTVSGGDTNARTEEAINLYKAGWAKTLIFSGAAQDPEAPSNALVMKRLAVSQGVPGGDILIEEHSRTTNENASNVRDIAEQEDIKSVILVTSAYHQRRAYLEFKKKLDSNITIRNHPVARDSQWRFLWWLTPSGWWLVGGELAKIVGFYTGASAL